MFKKNIVKKLIILVSLFLVFKSVESIYKSRRSVYGKAEVRKILFAKFPQLKKYSAKEKALFLKNKVHLASTPGKSENLIPFNGEKAEKFFKGDLKYSYCNEYATVFASFLLAVDIPVRRVHMATKKSVAEGHLYDTHVALEALINDKWVYLDPTFNVHWEEAGVAIGVERLQQEINSKKHKLLRVTGEEGVKDCCLIDKYYLKYADLLDYIDLTKYDSYYPYEDVFSTLGHAESWKAIVARKMKAAKK